MPKSLVYIFVLVIVVLFLWDGNYRGALTVGLTMALLFIAPYWMKTAAQAKAITIIRNVWILGLCTFLTYESIQNKLWTFAFITSVPLIMIPLRFWQERQHTSPTQPE